MDQRTIKLTLSIPQADALANCLDAACRAGGIHAARAAAPIAELLDAANRASLQAAEETK